MPSEKLHETSAGNRDGILIKLAAFLGHVLVGGVVHPDDDLGDRLAALYALAQGQELLKRDRPQKDLALLRLFSSCARS